MKQKIKREIFSSGIKIKNIFNSLFLHYFQKESVFIYYSDFNNNWGDAVNPFLFKKITGQKVISSKRVFNFLGRNKISGIGSILQNDLSGHVIWGSGFIKPPSVPIKAPSKILSLRGRLSAEIMVKNGIEDPGVYGDPALLFPQIYKPKVSKKFLLGIIPHYTEVETFKRDKKLLERDDILIISPVVKNSNFQEIIDKIHQCQNIVSSSLHGLILADAYGIPSLRFSFKRNSIIGGNFKFDDYYSGVGIDSHEIYTCEDLKDWDLKIILGKMTLKTLSFDPHNLKMVLLNYLNER